jgi:hypothetical protein
LLMECFVQTCISLNGLRPEKTVMRVDAIVPITALAATLVFAACNNDDHPPPLAPIDGGADVLVPVIGIAPPIGGGVVGGGAVGDGVFGSGGALGAGGDIAGGGGALGSFGAGGMGNGGDLTGGFGSGGAFGLPGGFGVAGSGF